MTLQQAYNKGRELLKEASIEEYDIDAWYLLEHVTGISRSRYYGNPFEEISAEKEQEYIECINKRKKHIPLQHITGVQDFYGLTFDVNENVLIPRQDTEVLVEEVLKVINKKLCRDNISVLDMCTGSGCILLSILRYADSSIVCTGTGVDISEKALEVAKGNSLKLDIEAEFIHSDLFSELNGKWDIIVSNPPYIRSDVIPTLSKEVKDHDPMLALDGMEDGLFFYRKIVEKSVEYINNGGWLMFEIGHDQGNDVKKLMEDAGYCNVYVKKDLAGLDRIVCGMYYK